MSKGRKEKRPQAKPHVAALVDYIAKSNPNGVRKLAYAYGYPNFSTYEGSVRFLYQFLKKEGEKGLDDLMMQHPDKEALLEIYFSKNPQRIQFSSFTGPPKEEERSTALTEDQKALMDALGVLLAERKEKVVSLLSKYGEPVTNPNDLKEISEKLLTLLERNNENFNLELSAEIFALHKGEEKDFVPFVGALVSGIGQVAGSLLGKGEKKIEQNIQKNDNAAAITMAALNYRMNNRQQPQQNILPKPKDNTQLWIALGAGGSVLILLVVLVLFMIPKQKLI